MDFTRKEEGIRLKIRNKFLFPCLSSYEKKKLVSTDFTILSNNCWGGSVYESYNIKKMSPTVGMFFMPDDYIKFLSNLDYYLKYDLVFINPNESKYKNILSEYDTWGKYIIGKLDDIELHMLHYHDESVALNKWQSRVKRVNKKKLIVKFNDNNEATIEHMKKFNELPFENKIAFVSDKKLETDDSVLFIKQPKRFFGDGIKASFEPFWRNKNINITDYINNLK